MASRTEEIGDNKTAKKKEMSRKSPERSKPLSFAEKTFLRQFRNRLKNTFPSRKFFSSDFSIIGNFLELLHVQEYLYFADSKDRN